MEKGCDERFRFFEHLGLNFIKTSSLIWLEILEQFLDPCRCNADVCVDGQGLQVCSWEVRAAGCPGESGTIKRCRLAGKPLLSGQTQF